ncbi:hypothetical protein [Fructilactobacillus florum]|uniref:Glycosyl hydrolase family 32 N-terminal domain-containing protein n=1 Tax=Fructilactobacillus florum DSM 22689 = JCM 16035 TaxID=1423745 RepID=A0A0R2CWU6_9LACO|nr:hypothetical protein [Fructilactobacillus florum]KRM92348.1 hypothetical protein FC87_GL000481 [Fructilactobacillus florum DSM 22689 = JCM 16035]
MQNRTSNQSLQWLKASSAILLVGAVLAVEKTAAADDKSEQQPLSSEATAPLAAQPQSEGPQAQAQPALPEAEPATSVPASEPADTTKSTVGDEQATKDAPTTTSAATPSANSATFAAPTTAEPVEVQTPASTGNYAQQYHYASPDYSGNDTQSIFRDAQGNYHFYYLHNDGPEFNGPEGNSWYHVISPDLVHYYQAGRALTANNGIWQSMWTGSVIGNSMNFYHDLPADALVAYFTSTNAEGMQAQYAAVSTDGGFNFHPLVDHALVGMPNGGPVTNEHDARDPHVFYNEATRRMVCYLAEGTNRISQYDSADGLNWNYLGTLIINQPDSSNHEQQWVDYGTIECPNLIQLKDQVTKELKVGLLFGGNGYRYGESTGTYLVLGKLDEQGRFVPDHYADLSGTGQPVYALTSASQVQRVDDGSDFYGSSVLSNLKGAGLGFNGTDASAAIGIGWNGNWDYSGQAVKTGIVGADAPAQFSASAFHRYTLENGRIHTHLIEPNLFSDQHPVKQVVTSTQPLQLGLSGTAQRYELTFDNQHQHLTGTSTVQISQADGQFEIEFDWDAGTYTVRRTTDVWLNGANENYQQPRTASLGLGSNPAQVTVVIYTDTQSIELEFPASGRVYSAARYSQDQQQTVTIKGTTELQISGQQATAQVPVTSLPVQLRSESVRSPKSLTPVTLLEQEQQKPIVSKELGATTRQLNNRDRSDEILNARPAESLGANPDSLEQRGKPTGSTTPTGSTMVAEKAPRLPATGTAITGSKRLAGVLIILLVLGMLRWPWLTLKKLIQRLK